MERREREIAGMVAAVKRIRCADVRGSSVREVEAYLACLRPETRREVEARI